MAVVERSRAPGKRRAQTRSDAGPASRDARSAWLRELYRWHWISSAVCLVGMLLFAVTGITLNHAGAIPAKPQIVHRVAQLPAEVRAVLAREPTSGTSPAAPAVRGWLSRTFPIDGADRPAEWSPEEMNLSLPRPGGDAWMRIDRASGRAEYEKTERGVISLLNDLHKGRNTGPVWGWFLDIFAGGCVVFCVTGLLLLQRHARSRAITWPLVGLGLAAPLLLILVFLHL